MDQNENVEFTVAERIIKWIDKLYQLHCGCILYNSHLLYLSMVSMFLKSKTN